MIDFKKIIAKAISKVVNIDENEIEMSIEKPKGAENGDYAFPCFRLAKTLKKAPQVIATEIKENIQIDENEITKLLDLIKENEVTPIGLEDVILEIKSRQAIAKNKKMSYNT